VTTSTRPQPLLRAADPQEWLATHLEAHQSAHDEAHGVVVGGELRWVGVAELLDGDAAVLRREHTRMVTQDGTPPAAAAKWLVSWFAGAIPASPSHGAHERRPSGSAEPRPGVKHQLPPN
jgi:hypothetical protein